VTSSVHLIRTAKGQLKLGDVDVQLSVNNGPNHLHGGVAGWDKQLWQCADADVTADTCTFTLTSPHGDEGYPGTVEASITYHVAADATLRLAYRAALADAQPEGVDATVVNMTHHSYFNLSGGSEPTIVDHVLWTAADR
jgi:aldose 1-epimerase